MTENELRAMLIDLEKDELVEKLIFALKEKKEVQNDLKIVAGAIVKLLQNLGLMQGLQMTESTSTVISSVSKLMQDMMMGRIGSKLSDLKVLEPLLPKYKHLLKEFE